LVRLRERQKQRRGGGMAGGSNKVKRGQNSPSGAGCKGKPKRGLLQAPVQNAILKKKNLHWRCWKGSKRKCFYKEKRRATLQNTANGSIK